MHFDLTVVSTCESHWDLALLEGKEHLYSYHALQKSVCPTFPNEVK